MKRIGGLLVLLMTSSSLTMAQSVLVGRVIGADGQAMPLAHVELYPFLGRWQTVQQVQVEPDGTFALPVPQEGFYSVMFAGAMHRPHRSQFYFSGDTVDVHVTLARQWLDPDQSFTRVVGNFNDFEYETGKALEEVEPGVFEATLEVQGAQLIYELPGSPSGSYADVQLNHMEATAFRYKRLGEYLAVLPVEEGKATVRYTAIYDTLQVLPSEALLQFTDPESPAARFHAIYPDLAFGERRSIQQAIRIGQSRPANPAEMQLEAQVAADDVAFVIEREENPFQRMLYQFQYLNEGGGGLSLYWRNRNASSFFAFGGRYIPSLDQALLHQVVAEIPPNSLFWGIQPYWIDVLAEQLGDKTIAYAYVDSVIAQHPDPDVQATVLFNRFDTEFAKNGMTQTATALLGRLRTDFSDVDMSDNLRVFEDLDPQSLVGQPARLTLGRMLADGQRVNGDVFPGQVTLIDFTTPHCAACIEQVDALRTLQTTFADEDFAIWSVVLESSPFKAEQFAREHDLYDFTTLHGGGGFRSSIAVEFKAFQTPYRVLVDEKGTILQVGDSLFGESLESMLRAHFETDSAGGVR